MRKSPLVPDLWRAGEKDARRLYELLLAHLALQNRPNAIIHACRQIRRFARRGPGPEQGPFTLFHETLALCDNRDYAAAWRLLLRHEPILFGGRLDLRHHSWKIADYQNLTWYYVPLLYLTGRYRLGCSLLETALAFACTGRNFCSFDILGRVYNGDAEPHQTYEVTLSHFYGRLGKSLSEWRHWRTLVLGFHPRFFRLNDVTREGLLVDARLLPVFCNRLSVRTREPVSNRHGPFKMPTKLMRDAMEIRLRELFPILRDGGV